MKTLGLDISSSKIGIALLDNENVIIWFKWRGDSVVDGALNLCRNGSAIQISGTTVESE